MERHDRYLVVDRPDFDQGLRQLGGGARRQGQTRPRALDDWVGGAERR